MNRYANQTRLLLAVDCIIFGFDGKELKLLLVQRNLEPEKGKWSLMGGFVQPGEDAEMAASRVLYQLTGLENIYLEQLQLFSDPGRDPLERTVSVTYFTLINIDDYSQQISDEYHAEWFALKKLPTLIFDHDDMVQLARKKLKYKASLHPVLFELLPAKFTLPQLQNLYEAVYNTSFDKRNFSRKILSTQLLIRQNEKNKEHSKKGAFYYKVNKRMYKTHFHEILNIIPNPGNLK